MIKVLGIAFFTILAVGFVVVGVQEGDSGMVGVGVMTLVFAVLLLLGATVFRKTIDTEENARMGKKVIKAALTRRIDLDD